MKKWTATVIVFGIALITIISIRCVSARTEERLVVAAAFGQFQAFLLSRNYQAAYEMMAADFRKVNSFAEFEARGQWSGIFTNCNWNLGAEVDLNGSEAELRIKCNKSFGSTYYLVKENNRWDIRDKFAGFEE
jgi:hypothetical protein